jgi:hypothetical protein
MEFWQWVLPNSSGELLSAVTHGGGRGGYLHFMKIGEEVELSDLPWPLILGVNPDDKKQMAQVLRPPIVSALTAPLSFCFVLYRDAAKKQPLFDPILSQLNALATLSEYLEHVAEACEAVGLFLVGQEVHVPLSRVDLTVSFERARTGQDVLRPLILLRAALEMMSHSRGMVAADFKFELLSKFHSIDLSLLKSMERAAQPQGVEVRA